MYLVNRRVQERKIDKMRKFSFFFLLLAFLSGTVFAVDGVALPGDNILGQTSTDCDEGKANNEPRRRGKSDANTSIEDDGEAGDKTQDI